MDRPVDQILTEWRRLERELAAASDPDVREDLQARIAQLRNEYGRAVDDVIAHEAPPPPARTRA